MSEEGDTEMTDARDSKPETEQPTQQPLPQQSQLKQDDHGDSAFSPHKQQQLKEDERGINDGDDYGEEGPPPSWERLPPDNSPPLTRPQLGKMSEEDTEMTDAKESASFSPPHEPAEAPTQQPVDQQKQDDKVEAEKLVEKDNKNKKEGVKDEDEEEGDEGPPPDPTQTQDDQQKQHDKGETAISGKEKETGEEERKNDRDEVEGEGEGEGEGEQGPPPGWESLPPNLPPPLTRFQPDPTQQQDDQHKQHDKRETAISTKEKESGEEERKNDKDEGEKERKNKKDEVEGKGEEGPPPGWESLPPTLPPPPTRSQPEKGQMVCGGCRSLLSYPRGSKHVQCSCCQTVNYVLEEHEVGQVKCGNCAVLMMYPYGAQSVRCCSCRSVTDIGEHNRRPPLSVQQSRACRPFSVPL